MELLKQKYQNFTIQRQLNSLWNDYKKVSHLQDDPNTLKRLKIFLDRAHEYIKNYISKNQQNEQIKSIISDCTELVTKLFQYIENYDQFKQKNEDLTMINEILNSCLGLAEFILRQDKYQKQIQNSPKLLEELINLLEKVDSPESRIIIIKFMVMISENTDSKMIFAKNEGFSKLLNLLMAGDENTQRVIRRALIHFFHASQNQDENQIFSQIEQSMTNLEQNEMNTMKQKLSKLAVEFKKYTFGEIQKLFLNNNNDTQMGEIVNLQKRKLSADNNDSNQSPDKHDLIIKKPEFDELFEMDLKMYLNQQYQEEILQQNEKEKKEQINNNIKQDIQDPDCEYKETEKTFEILNSGFKAILEVIEKASDEIQIDLMNTIAKLLNNDEKYNIEFKKMNGYTLLNNIFNSDRDLNIEQNSAYIASLFELLEIIIIEKQSNQIMNYDAFNFLQQLIGNSKIYEIIIRSLDCLLFICQVNWKNIIITKRLNIFNCLINFILKLHKIQIQDDGSNNFDKQNVIFINNYEIGQEHTNLLLDKVTEILYYYAEIEGFFDLEFETNVSTLLLQLINKQPNFEINDKKGEGTFPEVPSTQSIKSDSQSIENDKKGEGTFPEVCYVQSTKTNYDLKKLWIFLMDLFLNMIDRKMPKKCCQIYTFDHNYDKLYSNIVSLFTTIINNDSQYLLNSRQSCIYLTKFLKLSHEFLSCGHKIENNESPILKQNIFVTKLISRNLCRDIQFALQNMFKKNKSSKDHLEQFIQPLTKYDNNSDFNIQILVNLKDLLIQNEEKMKEFISLNGLQLFGYLFKNFVYNDNNIDNIIQSSVIFFDILINQNNSFKILMKPIQSEIPPIYVDKQKQCNRIQCISTLMANLILIKQNLRDQNHVIFESIHKLCLNEDNFKIIRNEPLIIQSILEFISGDICKVSSYQINLYTSVLSVFNIYTQKFKEEEIDLCLDYLLNQDTIKKCNNMDEDQDIQFLVDMMSWYGIQMLLNSNPQIIERFLGNEYIYNLFGFLEISSLEVREMALKLVIVIDNLKKNAKKKDNFPKKKYFYQLLYKLINQSSSQINQNLCQTLYDLIFWTPDQINLMYPSNSSVICTILNRSEQGSVLLNIQKNFEQQNLNIKIKQIQNVDLIEVFIMTLRQCNEGDDFKNKILNIFEQQIDSNNINIILEQNYFMLWFYNYLKPISVDTTNCTSSQKKIYDIILIILDYDLKKKSSKVLEHLRKFHEDISFIKVIIKLFLIKIIENPNFLKEEPLQIQVNYLKNLSVILENLDDLIGVNIEINILMLQTINKMASNNSGNIRTTMKQLNLFDLRDNLLIEILRYQLDGDILMQLLQGVSFEALQNHNKFRESHALASLLKILLDHKDHLPLQILTIKIIKYDVAIHQENQKYVSKLLENPALIQYFYPNQNNKSTFHCFYSQMQEENITEEDEEKKLPDSPPKNNQKDYQQNLSQFLGPNSSTEEFLKAFHSQQWENERKQIILRIRQDLIPIENEIQKNQTKYQSKIQQRKSKLEEAFASENMIIQNKINKIEIQINQRLIKSQEITRNKNSKFMIQVEKIAQEGEILYKKLKSGTNC